MASSPDPNWKLDINNPLRSWFDEHKDYTFGPIKLSDFSGSSKQTGHYTQVKNNSSDYC